MGKFVKVLQENPNDYKQDFLAEFKKITGVNLSKFKATCRKDWHDRDVSIWEKGNFSLEKNHKSGDYALFEWTDEEKKL